MVLRAKTILAAALFLALAGVSAVSASASSDLLKVQHTVASPETIAAIAEEYGVSAADIQSWNALSALRAPVGTTLTLYVARDRAEALGVEGTDAYRLIHVADANDSLSGIAEEFSVQVADVVMWNRLNSAELRPGQMLMFFVSEDVYESSKTAPRERTPSPITVAADNYNATTAAQAEATGSPNFGAVRTSPEAAARSRQARGHVVVPDAIQIPGSPSEEVIFMPTADLHGYSEKQMRGEVAVQFAALTGAALGQTGRHVSQVGFGEYQIEAGDTLQFISFNDDALSQTDIVVRYDGHVSLPLIPDIKVGGRTRNEAEALIREAYGNIYREPEIALIVSTPDSKQYTVIGDIATPGKYPYTRPTTLNEAIFEAGGLRERQTSSGGDGGFVGLAGQVTQAYIIREVDGERQVIPHDLRGLIKPGDHEGDSPVFYGDLVYVPEGVNLVYLLGESASPRIVELTEGMTLLQMLSLSGGFDTRRASLKNVILLRQEDESMSSVHKINIKEMLSKGGADVVLQPGDIIYLPTRTLLRLKEWVEDFTGIISPWLDLYNSAVNAYFAYDLQDETLTALERTNSVSVTTRGTVPGITRLPTLRR